MHLVSHQTQTCLNNGNSLQQETHRYYGSTGASFVKKAQFKQTQEKTPPTWNTSNSLELWGPCLLLTLNEEASKMMNKSTKKAAKNRVLRHWLSEYIPFMTGVDWHDNQMHTNVWISISASWLATILLWRNLYMRWHGIVFLAACRDVHLQTVWLEDMSQRVLFIAMLRVICLTGNPRRQESRRHLRKSHSWK